MDASQELSSDEYSREVDFDLMDAAVTKQCPPERVKLEGLDVPDALPEIAKVEKLEKVEEVKEEEVKELAEIPDVPPGNGLAPSEGLPGGCKRPNVSCRNTTRYPNLYFKRRSIIWLRSRYQGHHPYAEELKLAVARNSSFSDSYARVMARKRRAEFLRRETPSDDSSRRDTPRRDTSRRGSSRRDSPRRDSPSEDSPRRDSASEDSLRGDSPSGSVSSGSSRSPSPSPSRSLSGSEESSRSASPELICLDDTENEESPEKAEPPKARELTPVKEVKARATPPSYALETPQEKAGNGLEEFLKLKEPNTAPKVSLEGVDVAKLKASLEMAKQMMGKKVLAKEMREEEMRAEEKLAQEKLAQEKLAQEKLAQEKMAREKMIQEKMAQEKLALDKMIQEKLAKERLARESLVKEKIAKEMLAREMMAKELLAKEKQTKELLAKVLFQEQQQQTQKRRRSVSPPKPPAKDNANANAEKRSQAQTISIEDDELIMDCEKTPAESNCVAVIEVATAREADRTPTQQGSQNPARQMPHNMPRHVWQNMTQQMSKNATPEMSGNLTGNGHIASGQASATGFKIGSPYSLSATAPPEQVVNVSAQGYTLQTPTSHSMEPYSYEIKPKAVKKFTQPQQMQQMQHAAQPADGKQQSAHFATPLVPQQKQQFRPQQAAVSNPQASAPILRGGPAHQAINQAKTNQTTAAIRQAYPVNQAAYAYPVNPPAYQAVTPQKAMDNVASNHVTAAPPQPLPLQADALAAPEAASKPNETISSEAGHSQAAGDSSSAGAPSRKRPIIDLKNANANFHHKIKEMYPEFNEAMQDKMNGLGSDVEEIKEERKRVEEDLQTLDKLMTQKEDELNRLLYLRCVKEEMRNRLKRKEAIAVIKTALPSLLSQTFGSSELEEISRSFLGDLNSPNEPQFAAGTMDMFMRKIEDNHNNMSMLKGVLRQSDQSTRRILGYETPQYRKHSMAPPDAIYSDSSPPRKRARMHRYTDEMGPNLSQDASADGRVRPLYNNEFGNSSPMKQFSSTLLMANRQSDKKQSDVSHSEERGEMNCSHCGQENASITCGKCQRQWYCNRKCQLDAWDYHWDKCRKRTHGDS